MKNEKPIIYGYGRVSTGEQTSSLKTQDDMIHHRAETIEDASWGKVFSEVKSASKLRYWQRPQFAELMKVLPGNILIVWRLDRLERSMLDMIEVVKWLVDHKVRLIVLQHGGMELDIKTTIGQMTLCMMAGFAQGFIDQMRITATEGRTWGIGHGYAVGRPPFGFHNVALRKLPGQKKPLKVTIPIQPEVVDEIVRRMDSGESVYSVAADFSKRDMRCKKKKLHGGWTSMLPWAPPLPRYHIDYRRIKAAYNFWKNNLEQIGPLLNPAKSNGEGAGQGDFDAFASEDASEACQSPEPSPCVSEQSEPPSPLTFPLEP